MRSFISKSKTIANKRRGVPLPSEPTAVADWRHESARVYLRAAAGYCAIAGRLSDAEKNYPQMRREALAFIII